jgi:tape measure domain-containing protein
MATTKAEIVISARDETKMAFEQVKGSLNNMQKTSEKFKSSDLFSLGTKGLGAAALIASFSSLSDSATKLNGILKNSSGGAIQLSQSFTDVQRIASAAQVDLLGIGTVYARISNSLKDYGVNQKQVSDITETLSLALKVNGATAEESASTLLQLSQAFGSGKLAGDEFRSAMEAAPNVMRQLATSMKVPFGSLKDLAAQGKITSDVLLTAFTDKNFLASLRQQSKEMKTINGSLTELKNSLTLSVSSFNKATGASNLLATGIGGAAAALKAILDLADGRKINWDDFIPGGGKSLIVGKDGKVTIDFLSNLNKKADDTGAALKQLNSIKIDGKFIDIGTMDDYQRSLVAGREALDKFLDNKEFDSKTDAQKKQLLGLATAFKEAVKDVPVGSEQYITALKRVKDKEAEILNTGKDKAPKKDVDIEAAKRFVENLQKERDTLTYAKSALVGYDAAQLKLNVTQRSTVEGLVLQLKATEDLKAETEAWAEQVKLNTQYDDAQLAQLEEASSIEETRKESLRTMAYELKKTLDPTIAMAEAQSNLNDMLSEGLIDQDEYAAGMENASEAVRLLSEKGQTDIADLKRAVEGFGRQASQEFVDFAFSGKGSVGDLVTSVLKDLARLSIQRKLLDPLLKGFDSSLSGSKGGGFLKSMFGGFFANGGSPPLGKVSVVGERGPELFVPNTAGTIIPNNFGGGGNNYNVNVSVDATGGSVAGNENKANDLGRQIEGAVRAVLLKEKRPGGVLA